MALAIIEKRRARERKEALSALSIKAQIREVYWGEVRRAGKGRLKKREVAR